MKTTPTITPILTPTDYDQSWKLDALKETYEKVTFELPDTELRKRPTFIIPRAHVGDDVVTHLEVLIVSRFTKAEEDYAVTATGDVINLTKFASILSKVIWPKR